MEKVTKTEEQWKQELGDDEYRILREAGTEPAFTGEYWDKHDDGTYRCRACEAVLFDSGLKFDSGTGWPSFTDVAEQGAVELRSDNAYGMRRTEVVCARCESHLGHVFPDGPGPTGMRYCINSACLRFDPEAGDDQQS